MEKTSKVLSVLLLAIFLSGLPSALAGNGVSTTSSSGVGSTDSISNGYSSVSNINNAYDSSSSSYTRLLADGDFSGNFGSFCGSQSTTAYAEVAYTLSLQSNANQSMTMSVYSQTEYDFSSGWSTVPSLKMTANVTDNGGTWNAWTSTSTNNSASPSSGDIDLGPVTPRSNNTIDVVVRLEHQGVWTSSCRAELRVYDFFSDAVVAPNIAYSGSPFTFTKDNTINTITPTNTGGSATSWSITSGSLPSGLSMSSSTGALTGTPTSITNAASITIQASNSGGSDSTTISITVEEEAPNIAYSGSPYTFTKESTISTITPSNTGGAASSWSITSGSLPSGLSMSSSTGALTGTPTVVSSAASITIQASNSGGSDSTTISITVNDEAPNIAYSGSPFTFTKDNTINTITPSNTGGASSSWSITSGSLPSGLSLSSTTGTISGTPTAVYSTSSITIQASNSGGSDSATISITVDDEAPNIAYGGPYTFTKNTAITTITPSNTGGAATSWSITSGSLPTGLSMSSSTGAITGTPTAVYSTSSITIEASNSGGSDSTSISITVQDEVPNIGYGGPYTFTKNVAITTITPTNTGGAAASWTITSGSLPTGLSFSTSTGSISGTPTAIYSTASITIEASNAAGSDSATLSITVEDKAPNIGYGGPYTFTKNTAISTISPTNTGGAATSWSITSGSLPTGLTFSTSTGSISGTPTIVYSTASITIQGSNGAGSDSATLSITVQDETPNIAYGGPYTFTKDTNIPTITPSNTGGAATSWSITSGSLPTGLTFSTSTGFISGTPTAVYSTASITIEASNAAGSDSATISITVEDQVPNIGYGGPYTFTKNTAISTITPSNTGGAATSWSITSGSLPAGLSFSSTTGAISGTPTVVYSTASITIEASNAAGSDSASISLTVQDEAPNIDYGGPYTFTKNTVIDTIVPTNTGGQVSIWNITSGSLPSGLSMSSSTGVITGTPTSVYNTASVTIEASNGAGLDSATISFTIENVSSPDPTNEHEDGDGDGIVDVNDACLDSKTAAVVDESGCAFEDQSETAKDEGDNNSRFMRPGWIFLALLVVVPLLLSRFKDDSHEEVVPFSSEFYELVRLVQGPPLPDEKPLCQVNDRFARFLGHVETKSERIGGNHHVKNIQHLCLDMKKEVYLPKGAVVYLRALSTCLARIYRDSLASMGWKNALRKQYNGKDASGKQILEELKRGKNKRIKRLFQKNHGYVIDEELVGRVMLMIERWNNVLHPEDGTREYTDLDLEKGMRTTLDFLAAVDEVHSISSRLPIEII